MSVGLEQSVRDALRETARLHEQAARDTVEAVIAAADLMQAAFRNGAKVLIFGNGGSAADAQHWRASSSAASCASARPLRRSR